MNEVRRTKYFNVKLFEQYTTWPFESEMKEKKSHSTADLNSKQIFSLLDLTYF